MKCTAPQYVDFVMSSVQKLVTDEDVFPTKYGKPVLGARSAAGKGGRQPQDLCCRARQVPQALGPAG